MYYVLDICPKCMDKLYERKLVEDEEDISEVAEACCPHCGHRLIMACCGERKHDDTKYKIFLTNFLPNIYEQKKQWKDQCVNIVMKLGHCNRDAAIEKLGIDNSILSEGNLFETYLNIRELNKAGSCISYRIEPKFPYLMPLWFYFCPTCEGIPVEKTEELGDNLVRTGIFCEKCKKWVQECITSKEKADGTLYHLKASLKGIKSTARQKLLDILEDDLYHDKEVTEDEFKVNDLAANIRRLLEILKACNADFEIDPSYPYEIVFQEKAEWTEEDIELLKELNPDLEVTVEEMNAIRQE